MIKHLLITFILLVFTCSITPCYSQTYTVQLQNRKTGKTHKPVPIGARVVYSKWDSIGKMNIVNKGHLQAVHDSVLIIDGKEYPIKDLSQFSRRRKGSGFASFLLLGSGSQILINGALLSSVDNPKEQLTAGVVGVGLLAWYINVVSKNCRKDITKKWKLNIVEVPKK